MIESTASDWLSEDGEKFNLAILILASVNILAAVVTAFSIINEACSNKECPKTRSVFTQA